MKILVPVKRVATLDDDFEIRADGRDVDQDYLSWDLNEWDDYSLETAMQIKEAAGGGVEVSVVTVGPDGADEALRKCLAKGADRALRVWDDALEDADPLALARVLAAVARKEAPHLVFAGVQSSDHGHGSTGIALAGLLGWPHAAVVAALEVCAAKASVVVRRELEAGLLQSLEVPTPAVLTIQLGINSPRYASLRGIKQAASRPIELLAPADLGLADGELHSHSRVRRMYRPEKGRAQMIEGTPAEQAARIAEIIREVTGA